VHVKQLSGVEYVSIKRTYTPKQCFNWHLFHAGQESVVWPKLSFIWSRMTAQWVIDTLSHSARTVDSKVDIDSTTASVTERGAS